MALREEFEKQGNWLFRWRSYIPVLCLPLFYLAMKENEHTFQNYVFHFSWEVTCLLISFLGLGIRILTVGFVPARTSGRNTKRQVADSLNMTGMYSIVRHPLYLGNFIIVLGLTLFTMTWWLIALISLLYWIYYERIMFAEEEFLRIKFVGIYEIWAEKTHAFIPDLRKWKSPELQFSLKTILKREFTGFFGIIVSFTFLDFSSDFIAKGNVDFDIGWIILLSFGIAIYLTVILIKKKSRILHVQGR